MRQSTKNTVKGTIHEVKGKVKVRVGRSMGTRRLLSWPLCCRAYSVLSHEADHRLCLGYSTKPILLKRFPNATSDELRMVRLWRCHYSRLRLLPARQHLFQRPRPLGEKP